MKKHLKTKFNKTYRVRKVIGYTLRFLLAYYQLKCISFFSGRAYYQRNLNRLLSQKGEELKDLFTELEGLFIKAGQFLSIAGFFLPETFKKQLEGLQDAATPKDFSQIQFSLLSHYAVPLSDVFTKIEATPMAVASIGQVHKAWLKDNTPVVLKIQHEHIERIAEIDLTIIRKLTYWIGRFFALEGLDYAYKQVEALILQEIDFEKEANSLISISSSLSDENSWSFPTVFSTLSGRKVLVMSWMDGKKITDKEYLYLNNIDPKIIVDRLWNGFCRMIFEHGFYHADPHPGNILVDKMGNICLLDFGAVSTLSPLFKKEIPGLIIAFSTLDVKKLTQQLITLGFINDSPAAESLAIDLAKAFNQFLENDIDQLFNPEGAMNPEFWNNPVSHIMLNTSIKDLSASFRIPKDYILLGRTFSLLLGVSFVLRPGENPLKYLSPIVKKYLNESNQSKWFKEGVKEAGIFGRNIISLPKLIRDTVEQFQTGNSSLKTPDIWRSAKLLYLLGQQFALLILTFSLLYIAREDYHGILGYNISSLFFTLGLVSFLIFLFRFKKGDNLFRQ
ncbi:MAG: AarF/UbiB family protein [Saprospiraceae bacterium]|nr:AarF/UbiB family protein [Saprospiraceae bacterium]